MNNLQNTIEQACENGEINGIAVTYRQFANGLIEVRYRARLQRNENQFYIAVLDASGMNISGKGNNVAELKNGINDQPKRGGFYFCAQAVGIDNVEKIGFDLISAYGVGYHYVAVDVAPEEWGIKNSSYFLKEWDFTGKYNHVAERQSRTRRTELV